MNNFDSLSQEELLQAAQEAYEKELQNHPSTVEDTESNPIPQVLEQDDSVCETTKHSPSLPTVSTNATALGIAIGLVVGAGMGFLTGMVPSCVTLGILLGVTLGLWCDVRKDKKVMEILNPKTEQDLALEDRIAPTMDQSSQEDEF